MSNKWTHSFQTNVALQLLSENCAILDMKKVASITFGHFLTELWTFFKEWVNFGLFVRLAFRPADALLTLLYCAILGKSYSLLQYRCSYQFFVHCSLYCAVVESTKSTKHTTSYWDARTPARNWRLSQSQLRKIWEEWMKEWKKERQSLGLFTIRC